MRLRAVDVMDGRVLIGVIGVLLLAAAAYEYMLVQGLASAADQRSGWLCFAFVLSDGRSPLAEIGVVQILHLPPPTSIGVARNSCVVRAR